MSGRNRTATTSWARGYRLAIRRSTPVVALLIEHPRLMQRPVLVKGGRAIIGRPKDRVEPFLRS